MVEGLKGKLRGVVHLPYEKSSSKPPIIMVHGYFSATKLGPAGLYVQLARKLAGLGFPTYRFDFYGVGDSDGDYREVRYSLEKKDLKIVSDYVLKKHKETEWPILIGHSFGANIALASSAEIGSKIVVALSSIPSKDGIDVFFTPEMLGDLASNGHTYRKGYYIDGEYVERARGDEIIRLASKTADILLVHGTNDEFVRMTWPTDLCSKLAHPILEWVKDGDHNYFPPTVRRDVLRIVTRYLADYSPI